MKKLLFIPLLFFICSPFLIHAQTTTQTSVSADDERESAFGIGPRLGYYTSEDADDGNFYGGLQLRARTGPSFGIEAAVDYRTAQTYSIEDYSVSVRSVPVTLSAMLFIPMEGFAPYGLAGIGAYYTIYDYSNEAEALGIEDTNNFNVGYHLGFGIEIPFNRDVALNFDYRYLFLNPDENEENLNDASFNGNVFTAGLTFYL